MSDTRREVSKPDITTTLTHSEMPNTDIFNRAQQTHMAAKGIERRPTLGPNVA